MQKFVSPKITSLYLLSSFRGKTKDQIVLSCHKTKIDAQEAKIQYIFEYLKRKNGDTLIKDMTKMNAFILKTKDSLKKASIGYYAYSCPAKNFNKVSVYVVREVRKLQNGFIYASEVLIKEVKKKFSLNVISIGQQMCDSLSGILTAPRESLVKRADIEQAQALNKSLVDALSSSPVMATIKDLRDKNRILSITSLREDMPDNFGVKIIPRNPLCNGFPSYYNEGPSLYNKSLAKDIPIPPPSPLLLDPFSNITKRIKEQPLRNNATSIHQQLAIEALAAFRARQKKREEKFAAIASAIIPGIANMPKYSSSI